MALSLSAFELAPIDIPPPPVDVAPPPITTTCPIVAVAFSPITIEAWRTSKGFFGVILALLPIAIPPIELLLIESPIEIEHSLFELTLLPIAIEQLSIAVAASPISTLAIARFDW